MRESNDNVINIVHVAELLAMVDDYPWSIEPVDDALRSLGISHTGRKALLKRTQANERIA